MPVSRAAFGGALAMAGGLLALVATTSGSSNRDVWRRAGDEGLGQPSVGWLLGLIVAAAIAGALNGTRRRGALTAALAAGATTVGVIAAAGFGVEWLASGEGHDLNLQPAEPLWWALNLGGAFCLALFVAPVVGPGLSRLGRLGVVTASLLAVFMTTWAAAFDDNSEDPTPAMLSLVVLSMPIVLAAAHRYVTVPAWLSIATLVVHVGLLVVVLHDAVVCHDEDCLPVLFPLQLAFVAVIWWASSWIVDPKHTDFVLKN